MEQIEHVWDSGLTTPFDMPADAIWPFRKRTGSQKVVGLRWLHEGKAHEVASYASVLPDRSGVAMASEWTPFVANWLDVINADGSLRFRLYPPPLEPNLDHTVSKIEGTRPGWPATGIDFGVQAAYFTREVPGKERIGGGVLLDIDWKTGELKRAVTIQR